MTPALIEKLRTRHVALWGSGKARALVPDLAAFVDELAAHCADLFLEGVMPAAHLAGARGEVPSNPNQSEGGAA